MTNITSLKQAAKLSAGNKRHGEMNAKLNIEVDGETWHCYTIAVSNREFSCYCDEGTATYVVDSYGDRNTCELFDWIKDSES